jgi:hypothetical protein
MEKKQKRGKQELESLIPSIKNEEKHLDDLLESARAQADRLIAETESVAEERVRRAREEMPLLLAGERETRLAALQRQAEAELRAARESTQDLEKAAAERMEKTVVSIVSRVWPEGGS